MSSDPMHPPSTLHSPFVIALRIPKVGIGGAHRPCSSIVEERSSAPQGCSCDRNLLHYRSSWRRRRLQSTTPPPYRSGWNSGLVCQPRPNSYPDHVIKLASPTIPYMYTYYTCKSCDPLHVHVLYLSPYLLSALGSQFYRHSYTDKPIQAWS